MIEMITEYIFVTKTKKKTDTLFDSLLILIEFVNVLKAEKKKQ